MLEPPQGGWGDKAYITIISKPVQEEKRVVTVPLSSGSVNQIWIFHHLPAKNGYGPFGSVLKVVS